MGTAGWFVPAAHAEYFGIEGTHERYLKDCEVSLDDFLLQVFALQEKLGVLLVQLPPSLSFNSDIATKFFGYFRENFSGPIVCEPPHLTWFSPHAEKLSSDFQSARVAANPAISPRASTPGGANDLVYFRLHGSPKMYYSNYSDEFLQSLYREDAPPNFTRRPTL